MLGSESLGSGFACFAAEPVEDCCSTACGFHIWCLGIGVYGFGFLV